MPGEFNWELDEFVEVPLLVTYRSKGWQVDASIGREADDCDPGEKVDERTILSISIDDVELPESIASLLEEYVRGSVEAHDIDDEQRRSCGYL